VKRLTAIRNAKDWRDQLTIAEDKEPVTPFDNLFTEAKLALFLFEKGDAGSKGFLVEIGLFFARLLKKGDSNTLDQLSRALNTRRNHKQDRSNAAIIRRTLIARNGMFPPGKPSRRHVGNKLITQGTWSKQSVREVIESLKSRGVKIDKSNYDIIRREIQRQRKKLNIPLDHAPGKPSRTKRTHKP
jgi:hypothetical protein